MGDRRFLIEAILQHRPTRSALLPHAEPQPVAQKAVTLTEAGVEGWAPVAPAPPEVEEEDVEGEVVAGSVAAVAVQAAVPEGAEDER
jgi:hypothetical protein